MDSAEAGRGVSAGRAFKRSGPYTQTASPERPEATSGGVGWVTTPHSRRPCAVARGSTRSPLRTPTCPSPAGSRPRACAAPRGFAVPARAGRGQVGAGPAAQKHAVRRLSAPDDAANPDRSGGGRQVLPAVEFTPGALRRNLGRHRLPRGRQAAASCPVRSSAWPWCRRRPGNAPSAHWSSAPRHPAALQLWVVATFNALRYAAPCSFESHGALATCPMGDSVPTRQAVSTMSL